MSVHSDNNKEMLYELLKTIGSDNNMEINNSDLYNFISQRCDYFHVNRINLGYGNNLEEMNKKIVETGYNFIMSQQNKPKLKMENLQLTKQEVFEKNLESHESQFKEMINPKKPKDIDFSDKGGDFPMQNLDVIMNQTLADRQKELESITQKYSNQDPKKAQQWLNREEETPKIKIEKNSNIDLDNSTIKINKKKRVTWDDENATASEREIEWSEQLSKSKKNTNVTNFLSKLKQKPVSNNNDIMNKLSIIISNQEEILKLLKSN